MDCTAQNVFVDTTENGPFKVAPSRDMMLALKMVAQLAEQSTAGAALQCSQSCERQEDARRSFSLSFSYVDLMS